MGITEHKTSFAGYTLTQWPDDALLLTHKAYRMAVDYDDDEDWTEKFTRFVSTPGAEQIEALVVGAWWNDDFAAETARVVEGLVQHHTRLPNLKALFLADLTYEESEISWINQSDVSPLFLAYPRLEHFGTRGATNLQFGHLHHTHLRSFVLESGGTRAEILRQLAGAVLPQLTDFELWTGNRHYGWDGTLTDLMPFILGQSFPHLTRLALRNCEIANEVAQALVESPLYERLHEVDLSLGTLDDVGARALLDHPATRRLKRLNVSHHFCTPPVQAELEALSTFGVSVEIDKGERLVDWTDDGRYVSVGE